MFYVFSAHYFNMSGIGVASVAYISVNGNGNDCCGVVPCNIGVPCLNDIQRDDHVAQ